MITQSTRQGVYFFYILLMVFLGIYIFEMSTFEIFLVLIGAGIILKLTDIEEVIERRPKSK